MDKEIESAHWHQNTGREFQDAFYVLIAHFDPLAKTWRERIERPSYYCAGLAIEHFLKGYLTLKRIDFEKNHHGHDLLLLLSLDQVGLQKFFDLDEIDVAQITVLNDRYYNHELYGKDDLRYGSKSGLRKSPHPDNLNRVVKKMGDRLIDGLQKAHRR